MICGTPASYHPRMKRPSAWGGSLCGSGRYRDHRSSIVHIVNDASATCSATAAARFSSFFEKPSDSRVNRRTVGLRVSMVVFCGAQGGLATLSAGLRLRLGLGL